MYAQLTSYIVRKDIIADLNTETENTPFNTNFLKDTFDFLLIRKFVYLFPKSIFMKIFFFKYPLTELVSCIKHSNVCMETTRV